jgi:hypothetical protein
METLIWAQSIYNISLAAWNAVRAVPSNTLIRSRFHEVRSAVSGDLLDAQQIGHLVDLWIGGNPDARENESFALSIHAVAFRSMITVSEDGPVDDLNYMFKINGGLFDQFRQRPQAFAAFLKKYWNQAYSALLCSNFSRPSPVFIAE